MTYVLDTNILLHTLRDLPLFQRINREFDPYGSQHISITVEGEPLMEHYADIDAFSQSNHPTMRLSGSARKMSKNDLWIAATTPIFDGTLLTTDGDFNHLHNVFFKVEYIDPQLY